MIGILWSDNNNYKKAHYNLIEIFYSIKTYITKKKNV